MDMTLGLLVLGALLGGFVSGLAGFGGGPVVLVLWLMVIEPQTAVPLLMVSAVAHQMLTLHLVWKAFDLRRLLPMAVGGIAGVPIGVLLLESLSPESVRAVAGLFLVVYTLARLTLVRELAVSTASRWPDAGAGVVGGIMSGLAGLPGPVSTLWCGLRGWSKADQRAVFQPFNFLMVLIGIAFFLRAGFVTQQVLNYAVWCAPVLVAGVALGTPLYLRLNDRQFQVVVLWLMLVMGLILAGSNLFSR